MASVTIVSGAIAVFDTDHLDQDRRWASPHRKFGLHLIRRAPRIDASPIYLSSLTTLVTGTEGNGMKASPGTVLVVDTTPAKEAFGCNTITRTPD